MKGYEKYMPEKRAEQKTVLIQAHVPEGLHAAVKDLLEREEWTWSEAVCGLLAKLVDDSKKRA